MVIGLLIMPSGDLASAAGPPFTPRHVDEEQQARVTTPCCTFVFVRLNASDPDNTGFYDKADARARGNGSTPASVRTIGFGAIAPRVVWFPNASWYVQLNATGYDSFQSDSFDHLDSDANLTVDAFGSHFMLRTIVRCREGTFTVPGPENCVVHARRSPR